MPVENRRSFITHALVTFGGLIATGLFVPMFRYLLLSGPANHQNIWVKIADLEKITENQPVRIAFKRSVVDGWVTSNESTSAWIIKPAKGEVIAFAPQCTHLGCAYFWDDSQQNFNCPCHGSTFRKDGTVKKGPAGRPLDRFATRVDGHQLLIHPIPIVGSETA